MSGSSTFKQGLTFLVLIASIIGGYFTKEHWLPLVMNAKEGNAVVADSHDDNQVMVNDRVVVSEQAQLNLGLRAKSLKPQSYWRTLSVPGMITDKPGQSDRGIVAPVTGVITKIFHCPCDMVKPGDTLFQLKLLSETLLTTQANLYKSLQEIELANAQKKRLSEVSGVVPESRLIEIDNQILRQELGIKTYRAELYARGLNDEQIANISKGNFINEMTIRVPPLQLTTEGVDNHHHPYSNLESSFEMQELKVDLGQQVLAGQTLCTLANHQQLIVEGRAFRNETVLLERAVSENWPIDIDFQEENKDWGEVNQQFYISHLANVIDPETRTFEFHTPLENQARVVKHHDHEQILWRFRPGQKVRMKIKIEKLDNVFVLPADAVAKEGVEAYIFAQNVNTFQKIPVRILHQESKQVVLANDNKIQVGIFVVQSAAEQLNRMLKSGDNTGVPKGYHMHADGSLHKNGDPE